LVDLLSKSIQGQRQTPIQQSMPEGNMGIDEDTLRNILDRIANLENELDNFKNEFGRWVKEF
jgi:hypothetical protein